MQLQDLDCGGVRLPLVDLTGEQITALLQEAQAIMQDKN